MAKLVDVPDLGSGAARHGGSSPSTRTNKEEKRKEEVKAQDGGHTFFLPISNGNSRTL